MTDCGSLEESYRYGFNGPPAAFVAGQKALNILPCHLYFLNAENP